MHHRLLITTLLILLVQQTFQSSSVLLKKLSKRDACNSCNDCTSSSCNNQCSSRACGTPCTSTRCCSTVVCNSCVSSCRTNCRTVDCPDNCANYCASSCKNSDLCQDGVTPCINSCTNTCTTDSCMNECSQKCENQPPVFVPVIVDQSTVRPVPPQVVEKTVIIDNQANHTAVIHVNNVINNTNIIKVPVFVNTTNVNNIKVDQPPYPPAPPPERTVYPPPPNNVIEVIKVIEKQNVTNVETVTVLPQPDKEKRCCYVIHPRVCQVLPSGEKKCYIRRHRECSDICSSSVVVIQRPNPIITPPQPPYVIIQPPQPQIVVPPRPPICQRIQQYPWTYCGNYQVQNCGQCYECGGMYNPQECSRSSSCVENCRLNMFRCDATNDQIYCI